MNIAKKPKVTIRVVVLLALFLGCVGSLDQVWCAAVGGPCEPQNVPCAGCSDSPDVLSGVRNGHLRSQSASWGTFQAILLDALNHAFLPMGDCSSGPRSPLPSSLFSCFALLRTVILII
jgi:hypothetical protein